MPLTPKRGVHCILETGPQVKEWVSQVGSGRGAGCAPWLDCPLLDGDSFSIQAWSLPLFPMGTKLSPHLRAAKQVHLEQMIWGS